MKLKFILNYTFVCSALAVVMAYSPLANAAVISQTLGAIDTPDNTKVGSGVFTSASDPAPFNGFIGSDLTGGSNLTASWTFSYGAIASPITSATLVIGLYDGDFAAPGSQLANYTIGAVDLTSALNSLMEATASNTGFENYYTVNLPVAAFGLLAGGSPTVSLALQGPGLGILGTTPFNGGGLDFSTITINTSDSVTTPLPAALPLFATGLGALGLVGWRRKRKVQLAA